MKRLFLLSYLVFLVNPCVATTVQQITFEQLCQRAELIFEGRVINVNARKDTNSPKIWTYVTFEVLDVVKGPAIGEEIQLPFLGGSVGDIGLQVESMRLPESGETGIYFVEKLNRRQPNPLLGWAQGHYLIEIDSAGNRRVMAQNRQPVEDIKAATEPLHLGISKGTPRGLITGKAQEKTSALTVEEFKDKIRGSLAPAGQPFDPG